MISIDELTVKPIAKKKESIKVNVPFNLHDSLESDWIKNKIKSNKEYLLKCTSKALYQKVEKDTLFLENEILPIIQAKTNLFFNDLTKKFVSSLNGAIENKCNSVVIYMPIDENYTDNPTAGIVNYGKQSSVKAEIRADFYLYNRDGNSAPFKYIELI